MSRSSQQRVQRDSNNSILYSDTARYPEHPPHDQQLCLFDMKAKPVSSRSSAFFDNNDDEEPPSFPLKVAVDDAKLSQYTAGTHHKSRREKEHEAAEAKKREEELNAAKAYAEFIDAFEGGDVNRIE
ncbi:hypothetical protein F5880DRAFT_1512055 [Lentinula raphanica]|nr:hypothetical protein F5880DRAFT_1512055 [Lentinula raphanica]